MTSMRLLRLAVIALLFAAGELAAPVVAPAAEALEEIAEETAHPRGRRSTHRPAVAPTPTAAVAMVHFAHRPAVRPLARALEPGHRGGLRKTPPPAAASSSSAAVPEDH
jgi:hypothetical protein